MAKKMILTFLLISNISFAVGATRVYHLQTEDENMIYVVVQNEDQTWNSGFIIEGRFSAALAGINVSVNDELTSLTITDDDGESNTFDIVGTHSSTFCLPECPGCIDQ